MATAGAGDDFGDVAHLPIPQEVSSACIGQELWLRALCSSFGKIVEMLFIILRVE